jgi:uncharacterized membrane protein YdbT with pleckstrin-like domain
MKPVRPDHLHLFEHDEGETLIGEMGRHPIGIFLIFFNGGLILSVVLALLFLGIREQNLFLSGIGQADSYDASGILTLIAGLLAVLLTLGTFIAAYVYINNYLILTDRKLVFIRSKSIFARRISQLSIGDIQDVTVDQPTLLSRFFKYGTIYIETAGEQANFSFAYAVQPFELAKSIVDAHEKNLELYGN